MKKSNVFKVIFILAFALIMLVSNNAFAFDTENILEIIEWTDEYKQWDELEDDEKLNTVIPRKYDVEISNTGNRNSIFNRSLFSAKLTLANNSKYDLREYINITVKDQGTTGQCWAFAVNSALESNVEKMTGMASPIYSARYVEYATSKTFLDGINTNAYNREVNDGGFTEIALGLYTSGRGPVLEDHFPFVNNTNKINLKDLQKLQTQKQLKSFERFESIYKSYSNGTVSYTNAEGDKYTQSQVNEIRNQIKNHIITYGAVISQTYGAGGTNTQAKIYYNNPNNVRESKAYFCNNNGVMPDHQITIIGWDDTYKVENFNQTYRPSTPGAYIVLNSWGENFGENGVYYISYEDCFIEQNILGIVQTTDIDYDNIYQHDELGNNSVIGAVQDIYGANVFKRESTSKEEYLTQVSLASLIKGKCDIYINSRNGNLDLNYSVKVASNAEIKNGYNTIKLEKPILLAGNEFVIIVKYIAGENGRSYFGLEQPDQYFWATATAQKGESYISIDGFNWEDINSMGKSIIPSNSNLCIKAFTSYGENITNNNNLGNQTDLDESITPVVTPTPVITSTPTVIPTPVVTSTPTVTPTSVVTPTPTPGNTNNQEVFIINKYQSDDNYIYGISPNTKYKEFINNISTNMQYYIYNSKNQIVKDEDLISTGMTLKVNGKSYKLVVLGDINGDGIISIVDVVNVRLQSVNLKQLENEARKAADVSNDGRISIVDVVAIRLASVKLKNL